MNIVFKFLFIIDSTIVTIVSTLGSQDDFKFDSGESGYHSSNTLLIQNNTDFRNFQTPNSQPSKMALTTQAVITSLIEKYGNKDGDIVGLTQDELIRAFQQVNSQPTVMPQFLGNGETEWKRVSQNIAQFLNKTHIFIYSGFNIYF